MKEFAWINKHFSKFGFRASSWKKIKAKTACVSYNMFEQRGAVTKWLGLFLWTHLPEILLACMNQSDICEPMQTFHCEHFLKFPEITSNKLYTIYIKLARTQTSPHIIFFVHLGFGMSIKLNVCMFKPYLMSLLW